MVQVVNHILAKPITNRVNQAIWALQYADDTALIVKADVEVLITVKLVVRLFAKISGLQVNYEKSSFVPINVPNPETVRLILGCKQTDFPVSYLGVPFTVRKPTREHLMPLVEKIERRLEGWHGKLLSRAGSIVLVNAVLSSIPIYFMGCFLLPKWMLLRIDKIRRRFLWGKSEGGVAGVSLINWNAICSPKHCGGLGIPNLELRNVTLLLRWWWRLYSGKPGLWQQVALMLKAKRNVAQGPKLWIKSGSFFWGQLQKIRGLFIHSCTWKVGDGRTIAFWFDPWCGEPIADSLEEEDRPQRPNISLRDAWPLITTLAPNVQFNESLQFNEERDEIIWKWSKDARYSAKSIYKVLICGGRIAWRYKMIWKCHVPPNAKVFTYLMLKGKLLMHDVMLRRGFQCESECQMCGNCPIESLMHLLFNCSYASEVWDRFQCAVGCRIITLGGDVVNTWEISASQAKILGGLKKSQWAVKFICCCWHIWKHRNGVIFRDEHIALLVLANRTVEESGLWSKFC